MWVHLIYAVLGATVWQVGVSYGHFKDRQNRLRSKTTDQR